MKRNISTLIAVCAFLISFGAGNADAQSSPSNPIIAAIQAVQTQVQTLQATVGSLQNGQSNGQAGIAALQGSVNALQTTINAISLQLADISSPDQSNVRYTPSLFLAFLEQSASVAVTNVGKVPHRVKVEVIDSGGNSTVFDDGSGSINAGRSETVEHAAPIGGGSYAKFTVLDGTRADIRASIIFTNNGVPMWLTAE